MGELEGERKVGPRHIVIRERARAYCPRWVIIGSLQGGSPARARCRLSAVLSR